MMAHLAQQTITVLDNADTKDMAMVQNYFDKLHAVFRQFVDTVVSISGSVPFAKLLPQPELCAGVMKNYGLPIQYSAYIMRHMFKPVVSMSKEELEQVGIVYKKLSDDITQGRIEAALEN